MNKYKISIILPVYNVEAYIHNAMDSLINQTIGFEKLEIILVDDCSTDKSGIIIDKYSEDNDNVKAVHLEKNSGAAGTPRNYGLRMATSDFIMFLDPDDRYLENACEILYEHINSKKSDLVFGRYIHYSNNKKIGNAFKSIGSEEIYGVKTISEFPKLFEVPPSLWTKIIRRDFIVNNNIMFPEHIPGQDFVFIINCLFLAKEIQYLNNTFLVEYNIRDSNNDKSISQKIDKTKLLGLIAAFNLVSELNKKYGSPKYNPLIFKIHIDSLINKFIKGALSNNEKLEILKQCTPLFKEIYNVKNSLDNEHLQSIFIKVSNEEYETAIKLINNYHYRYKIKRIIFNIKKKIRK